MSSPFAIQPAALFRLTAIDPLALRSSTGSATPLLDSPSSIVELSGLGQVLAAGSTLVGSLQALQADTANPTTGGVVAAAQTFVAAFNGVGQSIATVLPFLATLPDNALLAQFSQTLNAAATSPAGSANLSSLQAIGISFVPASTTDPAASTAALSIDQRALNAAAQADPQATAALLAQATEPLLQQAASFDARATSADGSSGDLAPLDSGIPTNLLQNLPADTLQNNVQLGDLDLAAVGLDANTVQSAGAALATSLSATLAGPAITTAAPTASAATAPAQGSPATLVAALAAAAPATPVAAPAANAAGETAVTSAAPATSGNPSAPAAAANGETSSADQQASDARLALRNLLAEAALRDVIFDPAYSALIAASHLIDFVAPVPLARTGAIPADIPGAVLPINRARAIASYEEAARGFIRSQALG